MHALPYGLDMSADDDIPQLVSGPDRSSAEKALRFLMTLLISLALAFGVQAFLIKPYTVPSGSMLPTIQLGDKVFSDRVTFRFRDPKVGDIVIFNPPMGARQQSCYHQGYGADADGSTRPCDVVSGDRDRSIVYVKRVVAVAGDTVAFRGGFAYVNGRKDSFYHGQCSEASDPGQGCDLPVAIKVPAGTVFVSGDNRSGSADSRFWGVVPTDWVLGKAFFVYWPVKRIGALK